MIEFLNKGFLTTVQDNGRFGYQKFGVPVAGAMDKYSLNIANILVGNHRNSEALEVTGLGCTLKFHTGNIFALSGGDFSPVLNNVPIENNRAYYAAPGSVLALGGGMHMCRAYIAFAGGLDVDEVMGSKSTYIKGKMGGIHGRAAQNGDIIKFCAPKTWLPNMEHRFVPKECGPQYSSHPTVRVVLGPQDDHFTKDGIDTLFSYEYEVTQNSDRMGYRLEGPEIEYQPGTDGNIISDGISLGAIQIPNKKPIIMMADRQTTGGYTKIATVITVDLPLIAQLKAGDTLRFAPVDIRTAQQLYVERLTTLRFIRDNLDSSTILSRKVMNVSLDGAAYHVDISEIG